MAGNKSCKSGDMSRVANDAVMSQMEDIDQEVAVSAMGLAVRLQGGGVMCGTTSARYLRRHNVVAGNPCFATAERVVNARRRLQRKLLARSTASDASETAPEISAPQ